MKWGSLDREGLFLAMQKAAMVRQPSKRGIQGLIKAEKSQSEECNWRKSTQELKGEYIFQGEVDTWDWRKTSTLDKGMRYRGKQVPIYHCTKLHSVGVEGFVVWTCPEVKQTHLYQGASGTRGSSTAQILTHSVFQSA